MGMLSGIEASTQRRVAAGCFDSKGSVSVAASSSMVFLCFDGYCLTNERKTSRRKRTNIREEKVCRSSKESFGLEDE